jgi:hypothetical protein
MDDEISHSVAKLGGGFDDYYSHRDDMNSLYATTDDAGGVEERYDYGDYGEVRFYDASGTSLTESQVEATSQYTGRRPIVHGSSATEMVLVD